MIKRIVAVLFTALFLLPVTAWAEFPTTGILDNFNRANAGPPPSASWENTSWTAYGLSVNSNTCINANYDNDAYATWISATYGNDIEVYVTISSVVDFGEASVIAITNMAEIDGYRAIVSVDADTFKLFRLDNGTPTQLGSDYNISGGLANGDKIGLELTPTSAKAWFYDAGTTTWIEAVSNADTTYRSTATELVLHSWRPDIPLDDFGGGTTIVAETQPTGQIIFID